jgi:hypothetical protein
MRNHKEERKNMLNEIAMYHEKHVQAAIDGDRETAPFERSIVEYYYMLLGDLNCAIAPEARKAAERVQTIITIALFLGIELDV